MEHAKVEELNRQLWGSYESLVEVGAKVKLAFVLRVRDKRGADLLAKRLQARGCDVVWRTRKGWLFGRKWEVAATTAEPVTLALETIDEWSRQMLAGTHDLGTILTHWVPVDTGNGPAAPPRSGAQ